ncbi:hypothetical protein KDU71_02625 [Carboxylicivirga sediminis]|uniref:Uncharacterized protein n=1 Tax=Carboxylicivirga sediminis TaxID=2006564 RepID=A0A941F313_9BACT|nr:hypothetical protein [Carboxylicivirga sediminis]MBR8534440.1 hypothetical protein [Carboxylicivirga sediminis]
MKPPKGLTPEQEKEWKQHHVSLSTLFRIYGGFMGFIESGYFWFALISAIALMSFNQLVFGFESYELIVSIKELLLSTFPSILGFNIGAYALVIGFGDKSVLDKIRAAKGTNNFSLFQTIGGTFAMSVLIQATTFGIAFILHIFIRSFGSVNLFDLSQHGINMANNFTAFILLFFSIYSVALIPKIVLNVFSFSQLFHYFSKNS